MICTSMVATSTGNKMEHGTLIFINWQDTVGTVVVKEISVQFLLYKSVMPMPPAEISTKNCPEQELTYLLDIL